MAQPRRPDPRKGVFETLLVLDGRPVELDAHLARLHASLATLYPALTPPPLDVPSLMHPYGHTSDGTSAGALRIAVAPGDEGRLEATVERREAPRPTTVSLCSLTVSGGLGAHKWADRSLLDGAQAGTAGDALPLIRDADGAALEASRANVFAVRDGALFTPPLDGRILPGITRARVIEIAKSAAIAVHERQLDREDLFRADEVFLTGSVRGIEPVAALDGAALGAGGGPTDRLARALRRAWAGASAPVGVG